MEFRELRCRTCPYIDTVNFLFEKGFPFLKERMDFSLRKDFSFARCSCLLRSTNDEDIGAVSSWLQRNSPWGYTPHGLRRYCRNT